MAVNANRVFAPGISANRVALREARLRKGLSVEAVARLIPRSVAWTQQIFQGSVPGPDVRSRIAEILECPIDQLWEQR